ncbi:hypothetical protein SELMODRAFT_421838 [Selaginella moellendorffii]|uniref:Uncharacterized protein n=1 Tax=Selaginella moellendorffii TaxID=88036 RepID=D8SGI5_SELML|nr:hypothetical protein SELMODRAFT_421838 [Selaginella moellendorffii]
MEKLVVAALEEIAAEGPRGCDLAKLWSLIQCAPAAAALGADVLDDHIKQEIWRSLLRVPGLSITDAAGGACDSSLVETFETAERMGVVAVASQELRDGCLGLYDISHADTQPSQIQHAILERLASARTKGVTQNELGKEFKVEGNKLFYILRSLEVRGLIVRKSILLRNNKKNSSIVVTNLVHLARYALNLSLNSHQRLESNTVEEAGEGSPNGGKQLTINDDVPAMRAICEKLQEADGKVLVVSDLKLTLGYRLAAGHRAWRRLVKRLEEGGYVTNIKAKIGRKEKPCLQLLKPFNDLEQQSPAGDGDIELKGPKRGQVTQQLVDLSVDQQIYNMIDDEGADGVTMMEVWKRIGLNNKRNYYRIQNMTVKHGLLFEAENHKRSTIYRLRTTKRKRSDSENENDDEPRETGADPDSLFKMEVEEDANAVVASLQQEGAASTSSPADQTAPAAAFPPPSLFRKGQAYPCLTVTTTSIQREKHILARLQEEKFLVRAELHRWLESISSQKTTMDRKTLIRTLEKLQSEGKCKCVTLEIPGTTNCGRKRKADIVLLPSVELDFDLLNAIHERIRKAETDNRLQGREKSAAAGSTAVVVTGLKRMKLEHRKPLLDPSTKPVALQENGYIPAKMVRVRMLHHFLWRYTNNQHIGNGYRIFGLTDALLTMPLELFLQVVGSSRSINNLAERCKQGTRICELSPTEQAALLDSTAGGRLAWLVDVLRRLKLLRFALDCPVSPQATGQFGSITLMEATVSYAMEEQIYIQEPPPPPLHAWTSKTAPDSLTQHNFDIVSEGQLEKYWEFLEYFYSGADPSIARHAFPGSNVPEVFGLRSWTSLRVMTMDQRNELFKRLNDVERLSVKECAQVSKDLNLTLQQVLRYSYEKNRRLRLQSLKAADDFMEVFTNISDLPGETFLSKAVPKQITEVANEDASGGDEIDDNVNHGNHISVNKLKPARSRFPWSDSVDRVVAFAYAKHRALTMNRIIWKEVKDLPAPPMTCRRRISQLKTEPTVKKALFNLCSLLAARYDRYCSLEDQEGGGGGFEYDPEGCDMSGFKEAESRHYSEYYWDNPRDHAVASALDEFIRCKNLSRSAVNRQIPKKGVTGSGSNALANSIEPHRLLKTQVVATKVSVKKRAKRAAKRRPASLQIANPEQVVRTSLGAANAVELIKLIFLNSYVSDGRVHVPKAFVDGLHQFRHSDIHAAFSFLKDRSMVTSGGGELSFSLSEEFNANAFSSPLPSTTFHEFMAFSEWFQQHEGELDQGWVPYDLEENYGQLVHLLGRVTAGELRLMPRLPRDGIGESDDPRTIGCCIKRRFDSAEAELEDCTAKARLRGLGGQDYFQAARRERGFPDIQTLVHREAFTTPSLLHSLSIEEDNILIDFPSHTEEGEQYHDDAGSLCEPETSEAAMRAIQDGGEEGLSMDELGTRLGLSGRPFTFVLERLNGDTVALWLSGNPRDMSRAEQYVKELEWSGRVRRVNAFDHVRAVVQPHSRRYNLGFPSTTEAEGEDAETENTQPILPWFTSQGTVNTSVLTDLSRRVIGIVMASPGISEENLLRQMDVLNPQTARELVNLLLVDGKIVMRSSTLEAVAPPPLLGNLTTKRCHKAVHYYVNSLDTLAV